MNGRRIIRQTDSIILPFLTVSTKHARFVPTEQGGVLFA